jgi:hypothetical protein
VRWRVVSIAGDGRGDCGGGESCGDAESDAGKFVRWEDGCPFLYVSDATSQVTYMQVCLPTKFNPLTFLHFQQSDLFDDS